MIQKEPGWIAAPQHITDSPYPLIGMYRYIYEGNEIDSSFVMQKATTGLIWDVSELKIKEKISPGEISKRSGYNRLLLRGSIQV